MAGFFIGKTIEKWNLHRRIALLLVSKMGTNPARMVLGFMVATAVISMWISNTATAVMMTPVAIAVGQQVGGDDQNSNFRIALLLGVGVCLFHRRTGHHHRYTDQCNFHFIRGGQAGPDRFVLELVS
jgi:di/tricarboxylate transporter